MAKIGCSLHDPLAAGRSLDDSRQILSPTKAAQIDDLADTIRAWENLEQRHRERTGDQLPKDMRLAIFRSVCPTDQEKELTAQQHLFLVFVQMKARIVKVINSLMGNLSDEDSYLHDGSDESVESEGGELYRLEIRNGKNVFTKSRHEPSKGKLTENVSAVDALVTSKQIAEPKFTLMEDIPKICAQR